MLSVSVLAELETNSNLCKRHRNREWTMDDEDDDEIAYFTVH